VNQTVQLSLISNDFSLNRTVGKNIIEVRTGGVIRQQCSTVEAVQWYRMVYTVQSVDLSASLQVKQRVAGLPNRHLCPSCRASEYE